MRVLLLGGTGEARALAARLHPDTEIISSLAGRVPDPALPVGAVRIGGFGGVDGLRNWLCENDIGAVIDATHPFAATMTFHAAQACAALGMPHLVLSRPAWDPAAAILVASDVQAAGVVADKRYSRVFLTTGRSGMTPFTDSDAWFLIRVVTPPDPAVLPRHHEVVLSRGPYGYDDEYALLRDNRIDALVTKNSGGELTRAKLDAAAKLGVDVVMIDRPPLPRGVHTVSTVDEAVGWLAGVTSSPSGPDHSAGPSGRGAPRGEDGVAVPLGLRGAHDE
jgi:precorrin-6A/cobalt-precorrin-6A reductase